MRASTLTAIIAILATLAAGVVALRQHARWQALQRQVSNLETTRAVARESRPNSNETPATNDALSDADRLELMRLRAEVTRLRSRQTELASVRAENQALREQAPHRSAPPGYVRLQDARFAGQATPEAAFESFLWAIARGDTNVLCQLLPDPQAKQMMSEIAQRGESEFLKGARLIPGYRVRSVTRRSDTESVLQVELLPGTDPQEIITRLDGGRWRLLP